MSLIPLLFHDWEVLTRRCLLGKNFSPDLRPRRLSSSTETSGCLNMLRRNHDVDRVKDMLNLTLGCAAHQHRERYNTPVPQHISKDDLQVVLDVQHFEPEEIEVKVVDNYLVVTAKHEDKRDDHGWVSRQFVRRYQLPKNLNIEQLISKLSSDGLLTIVAPKIQLLKDETEKTFQIEFTGKPFVNEKQENPKKIQQSEEKEKPK